MKVLHLTVTLGIDYDKGARSLHGFLVHPYDLESGFKGEGVDFPESEVLNSGTVKISRRDEIAACMNAVVSAAMKKVDGISVTAEIWQRIGEAPYGIAQEWVGQYAITSLESD